MVDVLRLAALILILFMLGYIAAITDTRAETVTIYNYSTGEYSFIYVPDNTQEMQNAYDYSTDTWYDCGGPCSAPAYESQSGSDSSEEYRYGPDPIPYGTYGDPY